MSARMLRGLLVVAATLVACNGVLGIDQAHVDDSLTGGGGAAGAGGGGGNTPCDAYCDDIMKNCTGMVNAEYTSREVCMVLCSQFDPGVAGDTSSDSLECRAHYAKLAAAEPNTHCKHAGPLGVGACGTDPCTAFCLLDTAICSSQATPPYVDENACLDACKSFKYVSTSGDLQLTSGDTLNCRMYHLEAATNPANPMAADTHCGHTVPMTSHCSDMP